MVIVDRRERRCDSKYQTNELTGRLASFVALSSDSQDNCSVNRTISSQSVVIRNESQKEKPLIYVSLMVIVAAPAGLSGQISEWYRRAPAESVYASNVSQFLNHASFPFPPTCPQHWHLAASLSKCQETIDRMNIYVGNLSYQTTEDELRDLFAEFGDVVSAKLIADKFTGQSKGFGFVEMSNNSEAQKAMDELNGRDVNGRSVTVNEARPRQDRSRGGGGGDRGYGGGNRY